MRNPNSTSWAVIGESTMVSLVLLLLLLLVEHNPVHAFVLPQRGTIIATTTTTTATTTTIHTNSHNQNRYYKSNSHLYAEINDDKWDANVDYDKEWGDDDIKKSANNKGSSSSSFSSTDASSSKSSSSKSNPDPFTSWDDLPSMPSKQPLLGIGINLDPISKKDADEIKEQAKKVINEQFDKGIQDIEKMRDKMNREMEKSRKAMELASELNAREQSQQLMNKIDRMTNEFLSSNEESRRSTKLAAAASKSMESISGKGIEMGTWGTLGGRTVVASSSSSSLLGSVDNAAATLAKQQQQQQKGSTSSSSDGATSMENRILIIADTKQDQLAKQIVPVLMETFETSTNIPNLQFDVLTPTSTMPLGGNNAACVIILTTSVSQASSLSNMLDRLLRKTLQGSDGSIGKPPTQLVAISTVGTERYDKLPYNMQNLLSGGKLESRRQIEEVLINTVKRRITEPPLDYTIIKLGEIKSNNNNNNNNKEFALQPGDVLDDPTTVPTAVETIIQAVAYQPFARNSTLCISGSTQYAETDDEMKKQLFWDKAFLCLQGPELWRDETITADADIYYDELVEYIQGWGAMLAETGKGLTTPITYGLLGVSSSRIVSKQEGIELLFLPTKTGRNYVSKTEERQMEAQTGGRSSRLPPPKPFNRKTTKEGGIDVVVEIINNNDNNNDNEKPKLRIRARRCNYGNDAVIKELSEQTILKRLQDAVELWKRDHNK